MQSLLDPSIFLNISSNSHPRSAWIYLVTWIILYSVVISLIFKLFQLFQKFFLCFNQSSSTSFYLATAAQSGNVPCNFLLTRSLASQDSYCFSFKSTILAKDHNTTSCGRFENPLIIVVISLKSSSFSIPVSFKVLMQK